MKKSLFLIVFIFLIICSKTQSSPKFTEQPIPYVHIYDYTNQLTAEQKDWFNQIAQEYLQTGKAQIVTMLITNEQFERYENISDAAENIFNTWGIGEKGKDNGVLILLAPGTGVRKARIEVGYGLEKWLPDLRSKRILNTHREYYSQGLWFEALVATFLDVQAVINAGYQADNETPVSPNITESTQVNPGRSFGFILEILLATAILIVGIYYFVQTSLHKKRLVLAIDTLKENIGRVKKIFAKCEQKKIIIPPQKRQALELVESQLSTIEFEKNINKRYQTIEYLIESVKTIISALDLILTAKENVPGLIKKGKKLVTQARKKFKKNENKINQAETKINNATKLTLTDSPDWVAIETILISEITILEDLFVDHSTPTFKSSHRDSDTNTGSNSDWPVLLPSSPSDLFDSNNQIDLSPNDPSDFGGFGGGESGGGGAEINF